MPGCLRPLGPRASTSLGPPQPQPRPGWMSPRPRLRMLRQQRASRITLLQVACQPPTNERRESPGCGSGALSLTAHLFGACCAMVAHPVRRGADGEYLKCYNRPNSQKPRMPELSRTSPPHCPPVRDIGAPVRSSPPTTGALFSPTIFHRLRETMQGLGDEWCEKITPT